jgi:hypothetical protein
MIRRLHAAAGIVALATILTFWTSTLLAEVSGELGVIVAVKSAIPWGFLLLIPALAIAGGTGMKLAGRHVGRLVRAKRRRMPYVAANGLLVLVPAAFLLRHLALEGAFGWVFVAVQAAELLAGATNIVLLGLNLRDGLRLRSRRPVAAG